MGAARVKDSAVNRQRRTRRARSVRGRALLLARLVRRDIRHHLAQALLLVVAITVATATLTMALALNGVTSHPYAETRAATKGPDVVAYLTSASQATPLIHASGVAASSGPYPVASATIGFDGRHADVFAEGRAAAPAAVDRPDLTAGSWVRPGGIVIERTFAGALGVSAGDRVTLNGKSFTVAGIAVTAAQPPYPNLCYPSHPSLPGGFFVTAYACSSLTIASGNQGDVGVVWTTEADAIALTSKANPLTMYALNLKLANPNDAQAFVDQHFELERAELERAASPSLPDFTSWQEVASADGLLVQDAQSVLKPGALLLALLAIASVAVLVGRRLSQYARRVGLLKAIGAKPSEVAAAFLAENLALALFAAVAGLAAGWLASPLLTSPGAALIGAAGAPAISPGTIAEVLGVAITIALAATIAPAVRAARSSTVDAMNDAARQPRRRGALIRISNRLPIPALFGLRLVARRPRRAVLSAANIAVTVTGIVAVIAFHADVDSKLSTAGALTAAGLSDPVVSRDEQMLTVITIMLVSLAVLNALFTTWATVLDARRSSALMRALGARTRQVSSGLVVAQVLSALPGAVVGIPLGLGLFRAAVTGGALPPPLWLVATVIGTLAVMGALTIVPARVGSMQPIAEALQSEAA
jgi:putative ABC transport system permease protein